MHGRATICLYREKLGIAPGYLTSAGWAVLGPPSFTAEIDEFNAFGLGLLRAFRDSVANALKFAPDYETDKPLFKALKARSEKQMINDGLIMDAYELGGRKVVFGSTKPHPKYGAIGTTEDPEYNATYRDEKDLGLLLLKALIMTRDNAGARFRRMYAYLDEILAEAEAED